MIADTNCQSCGIPLKQDPKGPTGRGAAIYLPFRLIARSCARN